MKRNTILLIGGTGVVGSQLAKVLRQYATVITAARSNADIVIDVSSRHAAAKVAEVAADYVIYAAGFKDIVKCETNRKLAYVNSYHVGPIASSSSKFIYLSTDYVYGGNKTLWKETHQTIPTTIYGRSKLLGEQLAETNCRRSLILRCGGIYTKVTPWLIWLHEQLKTGKSVDCYTNLVNSPLWINDLATTILKMLEQEMVGIYNVASDVTCSRYELFSMIAKFNNYDQSLLKPTIAPSNVPIPHNLGLDVSKLTEHRLKCYPPLIGLQKMYLSN